ncbi:hypothetical protein HG535_0A01140 [Zygotorulaspora mrakii]|uniref:GYF domain-containing protein n=1 Tax=Zygotorulaspora mrakii TaxID=42260 RepID=A0A7H9AV63_ZYGMR|nr:uncharacterized protein HG535_0A01140 [Zygotorulaspora mrakii]QLG70175.1 hypothetical protein HG535_0A01140 [Zygotorulaspora mrakii]
MSSYEFSSSDPLKVRKKAVESDEDDESLEDLVEENGFLSKSVSQRIKRHKYLASYNSDSSEDDESDSDGPVRQREGTGAITEGQDSEDKNDMFSLEDEEEVGNEGNEERKARRLKALDINKFNEENLKNLGSETDDVGFNEEEGSIRIEAFNIEEESKRGMFDEDGNYMEAEEHEDDVFQDQDMWIRDFKDVSKTAEAQKKLAKSQVQQQRESQKRKKIYMLDEALIRLQYLLSKDDTVLDTLGKYNKLREKQARQKVLDSSGRNVKEYVVNAINLLADLVAILESKGVSNVYELNRPHIETLIKEESLTAETTDNYKTGLWHFKWMSKMDDIHGLYTNYQMQYWKQTYFNHKVVVKYRDEQDEKSNWLDIDCVTFM